MPGTMALSVSRTAPSLREEHAPHENPVRIVWALAWPAVALNSLQVVNTLLDRAFIGQLPLSALTAHGGAINVMFLMFSLAVAVGTAATALVSRAFGAREAVEYRTASRQALSVSIVAGFAMAGMTLVISAPVARVILPVEDFEAVRLMTQFLGAYAFGIPAIYVIQTLAGSLRGIGDTKSPMVISGIQILLHILLNFVLIFPSRRIVLFPEQDHPFEFVLPGFGLGLVGAGFALSLSAIISAVMYLAFVGRTPLGPEVGLRLPSREWFRRIMRIAVPAATMSVLRVLSLTAFTLVLREVPNASVAIAAMTTAFAIESIMFMPAFGLSMAAGALVGQSLGMTKPERAERLAWIAAHHAALVTAVLAVPIFIFAPQIVSVIVGGKPELVAETAVFLRWLSATEIGFAYAMVMIGAMQGAGDTVRPMWISVVAMWGLRVPMAFVLAHPLGMGALGAWLSMSLTQGIQGVMSVVVFKQGTWKEKKV
jgi:putative MATE family efflux protein